VAAAAGEGNGDHESQTTHHHDHEEQEKKEKDPKTVAEEKETSVKEEEKSLVSENHTKREDPKENTPAPPVSAHKMAKEPSEDATPESLHDLVKETLVLANEEPPKPEAPQTPHKIDTIQTETSPPSGSGAISKRGDSSAPSSPYDELTKKPSKMIRYRRQLIDEREFHEPVITPIHAQPEVAQAKRAAV